MQQSLQRRNGAAPAVLGVALIVLGGAALLARTTGVDLFAAVGPLGWPLFIIVPGLVLLGLSVVAPRPQGVGFAIAGSIVTTVGLLLLYQSQTGHWESWAYGWALLPAAAGLAQVVYGLFAAERQMVERGLWMAGIGGLLFAIGAWFFEALFAGEPWVRGVDWWPVALIALGMVIVLRAFVAPGQAVPRATSRETPGDSPPTA